LTQQLNSFFDSHEDAMTTAFCLSVKMKSTDRMIPPTQFNDLNFYFDAIYRDYGEQGITSHIAAYTIHNRRSGSHDIACKIADAQTIAYQIASM